eukprot:TRINITY_DN22474_c0_g1_i1.p1 TRINITY_DN22474_c0_g1~~TRINITY_DN22474_c0_g1_i1.p1  ORF type:complete len:254 (-),score=58.46 TRINITY_DN22474_c0_g1_i1:282-1043(-)
MLWDTISIAIAIACLRSDVAESVSEVGACPSLLQHSKHHSPLSSLTDEVDSCRRIMQRLQAFDSSDLLAACKAALDDTALCLEAEQELRRAGKPCAILSSVWGQLQDRTRVLLLERRSRKRMNAVHRGSSLVKRGDSNQKDEDAAATSDGNETNRDNATDSSDGANATGGSDSTSNDTAVQGSGDGAEREVWDNLLQAKANYNNAPTEPIPSNPESDRNASDASSADKNEDLEDAAPSSNTEVANRNQSNTTL